MIYIIHETLKDRIPAARSMLVTSNAGTGHEFRHKFLTYDIHDLDFIIDELKIDIAIVNTCLTHEGKKLKMIMSANDYQEYY